MFVRLPIQLIGKINQFSGSTGLGKSPFIFLKAFSSWKG